MEYFEKIKAWIMANKTIAIIAGAIIAFLVFGKQFKKLFGGSPRRRRRSSVRIVNRPRRTKRVTVNAPKGRSTSYNRIIKSGKNRGKKAWQIKGSPEARRRMAALRRMRRK